MTQETISGETMEAAAPVETAQSDSPLSQEQASEGTPERTVPLQALEAERAQRQNLQEELGVIKDHIALMQAQQSKPKQQDDFVGISKDDVITYGELETILSKKERQYQMPLDELKMMQKHPDYNDVITKHLPEVFKQNPGLRNTLQQSQDFELAYHLAKNSDSYRSTTEKKKVNADAERIIANSQQTGSLSSTGSNSPINQAKRYKDMSDADFNDLVNRNMGGF